MKTWLVGFVVVCLVGCGGSRGPTLYRLTGEVLFDGKPVPYGRIEFEPDTTRGNSGGMGYAEVVDGKYDTSGSGGRGVVGGPHVVRVSGFAARPVVASPSSDGTQDENAPPAEQPEQLFASFVQSHDLPKQNGSLNIDVPVEAGRAGGRGASPGRPSANDP